MNRKEACQANPNFHPVAAGGDGAVVQYWYVGYDMDLKARLEVTSLLRFTEFSNQMVIVGHQGTNPKKM